MAKLTVTLLIPPAAGPQAYELDVADPHIETDPVATRIYRNGSTNTGQLVALYATQYLISILIT